MGKSKDIRFLRRFYDLFDEKRYKWGDKHFKGIVNSMSPLRLVKEGLEETVDCKLYNVYALHKLAPSDGRLRIFISGAYSGDAADIDNNIAEARKAAGAIAKLGHFPITPHMQFAYFEQYYPEIDYSFYLEWSKNIIPLCHGIYMVNFWQKSPGANQEIGWATQCELSIFFSLGQIPSVEDVRKTWKIFDGENEH